jgi:hypothetical protein
MKLEMLPLACDRQVWRLTEFYEWLARSGRGARLLYREVNARSAIVRLLTPDQRELEVLIPGLREDEREGLTLTLIGVENESMAEELADQLPVRTFRVLYRGRVVAIYFSRRAAETLAATLGHSVEALHYDADRIEALREGAEIEEAVRNLSRYDIHRIERRFGLTLEIADPEKRPDSNL